MWIWHKFLQPWYQYYFGLPIEEDKEKKKDAHVRQILLKTLYDVFKDEQRRI